MGQRVIYRGRVQGVGFRATTQQVAEGYLVRGWVKNCPDGTVELCVDGKKEEVAQFRSALERRLARQIQEILVEQWPMPDTIDDFSIQY